MFEPIAVFSDDILFSAKISGGRADYVYKRMKDAISEIDNEISLSKADSALSRFNNAAQNERIEVGEHAFNLFKLSCEYYELTDGAFNCAALPLSRLWRVDSASLACLNGESDAADLPSPERVNETTAYCDPNTVTAECVDGRYYLTKTNGNTELDFGGIAKGYAVDECVDILNEYDVSSALIDISGNAYFYGSYIDSGVSSDWGVGVLSPRPRNGPSLSRGYVVALSLGGDVSAVTSGDYMRYRTVETSDGKIYVPHIMRANGVPLGVEYDGNNWKNSDDWVISATVIGNSSALSDALSTAMCALGIDKGGELLKKVGYKGLIFTEKKYTIIGEVSLYRPDIYDGYRRYDYYEL